MINPHRTGAYISGLRKAKDWTQLDLAQKLQVTHQAVSQWEKGATFPDIGLLPALARLFGVTVDDLLNGESFPRAGRLSRGAPASEPASAHAGDDARLVHHDPKGVDMMPSAAPTAQPSQPDTVVASRAGFSFTLGQITELAPFVTQDVLQSLLDSADVAEMEAPRLVELAPFIGSEALDGWAQRLAPGTLDLETLTSLAPFLGQATLGQMLDTLLASGAVLQRDHVTELAPFLAPEALEALLQRLPAGAVPIDYVVELAPFVSPATLDGLVERLDDPQAASERLTELAPFLSQASLKQVFTQRRGQLTTETLLELAPFLDQETLTGLLRPNNRQ